MVLYCANSISVMCRFDLVRAMFEVAVCHSKSSYFDSLDIRFILQLLPIGEGVQISNSSAPACIDRCIFSWIVSDACLSEDSSDIDWKK